ncbi:EAL domain-containing protein [Ancylothrix sp. C2]|uniref:EAL domain-containing protein n=1 Tax=Ancylothrix sp. D3o TaxID=2953691 RepID=UPI0021BAA3E0|nr:EAL domain-containing protein [Ancylothrix sp. D3o]MCT7948959.1 EAL domain-containing protein [Ancylothrix sp. D3o]
MQLKKPPIHLPHLEDVIDPHPLTVSPETPLIEVIAMMGQLRNSCPLSKINPLKEISKDNTSALLGEARASCVLIIEKQSPENSSPNLLGIFTERDLVHLIASGKVGLNHCTIAEVMTSPVLVVCDKEVQDVFTVLLMLRQHRIRHLPITNSQGTLLGVITPETIRQAILQPANLLKMRSVEEVMNSEVIQAPLETSVLNLAKQMTEHNVSCIIISTGTSANSTPIGMVTERDIVQFQSLELDLGKISAETVMSTPLFCLSPEDSLWQAHQEMQQRFVRRLAVANKQGQLQGIITQTSLLRVLDPMEMSGIIDGLQIAIEQRTGELQKALSELNEVVTQLESEIATRKQTEERLRLLESVVLNANDAIVIMHPDGTQQTDPTILFVNQAFTKLTGYSLTEIAGKSPSILRGPNSDPNQIAKIQQAFLAQKPVRVEIINYRKDGTEYWVELNSVPVTNRAGKLTHWISVQRDITERKRMEQALFAEKELAQVTLQSIGDGVITTDATGRISSLNPVAEKLTGWTTKEAKGLPLNRVFHIVNDQDGIPVENILSSALCNDQIIDLVNHNLLIARNGHQFAIDHSAAPIHSSCGTLVGAVLVFRDVTQIRTQARQLSWQASHDALTGLVNRREFEYQLEQAIFNAQRNNLNHILLFLDLDRFKIVNDTCGHIAGDELLRQVTQQFKTKIRKTDLLARLGGDEFAVILYQCCHEQGLEIAEKLLQSIHSFRFVWQDKSFSLGVSIGLVSINATSQNAQQTLNEADAACYAAKDQGRNRVHIYEANDRELAKQRGETQWLVRITRALEENLFCLFSQPIVPITQPALQIDNKTTPVSDLHCEILLRLQDPETGQIISPMAFIPAAERYHLMHAIDRWVIRSLFSQLSLFKPHQYLKLQQKSAQKFPQSCGILFAVNLSADSLNDEKFIDFLSEEFSLFQIPPNMICFEITETLAVANLSKTAKLIESLREMGCRFALDDFGSGMSSFAYLRNLPVDYLKIDGSFVKNIAENAIDFAMVEAINRIGHVMGIETIAEFVENEATLQSLKELGVDYAQGYAISKPHPLELKNFFNLEATRREFPPNPLSSQLKLLC